MPEIALVFFQNDYVYDIYNLVKAFYPGVDIELFIRGEREPQELPAFRMEVDQAPERFVFTLKPEDGEPLVRETQAGGEDRLTRKNRLKQLVYKALVEYTGRSLPWGSLTGIRPVRIPLTLLEQGMRNVDIAKELRETYFISPKKAALAIAIANRERDILSRLDLKDGYCLYVGIPFCPSICLYCSFGSHPLERYQTMVQPYMEALYKELACIARRMEGKKLTAVYIGGGTPTSLDAQTLEELLSRIGSLFSMEHLQEFTVEAGRPDTITEEKLCACLANGVTRISVNPQTMNQKTLDVIGRAHTVEQVEDAFALARELGFDNINMDLIAGLPGEGPDEVRETLRRIRELSPDSLTIHSLALKRSSRLNLQKEEYVQQAFRNSGEIMDSVERTAQALEMAPYYLYRQKNIAGNLENVGYARSGCFGLYNILIMEEKQNIMAAGSGAMTKLLHPDGRIERVPDVKDLKNYIERIDEMIARKEQALDEYERGAAEE